MKKTLMAVLAFAASALTGNAQLVGSFEDIKYWTGSGSNRSALVVEFNSSSTPFSVAWGYRWSGNTTLQAMVFDLAGFISGGPLPVPGSDPRLSVAVSSFGGMGYFIDTLTYDQNGLSKEWPSGSLSLTGWDGENWNNLFTLSGTSIWSPGPFVLSEVGMADTELVNGGWYGWVLANGPNEYTFAQPVTAVPEPSALALAFMAVLFFMLRHRARVS